MAEDATPEDIGTRARSIRRRRGLSLDTAAGLAGISKPYLSQLETGKRRFERRGLIENLAQALGCAVADLTGQPYLPPDRRTADAFAALPAISIALHDCTLTDAPDIPARPVALLAALASRANSDSDEVRYAGAGHDLGDVLTELHVHVAGGNGDDRAAALPALAEACIAAAGVARPLGHAELSALAARRAVEAARLAEDPALVALTSMQRVTSLMRLGARTRAGSVLTGGLSEVEPYADPSADDTTTAEGQGMLHLTSAQLAARLGDANDARDHLSGAREIAARTGEHNHLNYHFGPANVAAWSIAIGVELQDGPATVDRLKIGPEMFAALSSADRRGGLHLDLARAYAQAGGDRDKEALHHLDTADRVAPTRVRSDPIARELVGVLDRRARRRVWELDSLRNRFGVR